MNLGMHLALKSVDVLFPPTVLVSFRLLRSVLTKVVVARNDTQTRADMYSHRNRFSSCHKINTYLEMRHC